MLLVVRGDHRHTWIYYGDLTPNQWPEAIPCQGKVLRKDKCRGYSLPKGRFNISIVRNRMYDANWYALDGFPVGASCGSVLQWAGQAWEDFELEIHDKGQRLIHETDGLYTLEMQEERIREGVITEPSTIRKHRRLMKKRDDLAILRGLREMFKATDLSGFLRFPIRWHVGHPKDEAFYRLDVRHNLLSNEPNLSYEGQMFIGVSISGDRLIVDHWRQRSDMVDSHMDELWPTFDLVDPDCFQQVIGYAREALMAGSDQNLHRMLRRRGKK